MTLTISLEGIRIEDETTQVSVQISQILAELTEHGPIIIQITSNPSSRKNLDVRPYDRIRCYLQHAWPTVPRARQRHGFIQ